MNEATEIAKVRNLSVPLNAMMSLINNMKELDEDSVPCFSARVDKDKPQTSWTQDGLTLRQKSLTKQITNANAEKAILLRALSRYMSYVNNCCDAKYRLVRYKKELKAIELLRKVETKKSVANAEAVINHKRANTKGFKEREALKEQIKRKEPSSLECTKASVWDICK